VNRPLIKLAVGLYASVFVLLALVSGHYSKSAHKPPSGSGVALAQTSAEPLDFTVIDLAGKAVRLKDWRGRPVIVDFWATWCPPCRKEIPELNEIYRRYQGDGLVVLGVSMDEVQGEGRKVVKPFIDEFKIEYPIAMGDEALIDKLDLNSVPTALFIKRDGRLLSRVEGAGTKGELTQTVLALLKK